MLQKYFATKTKFVYLRQHKVIVNLLSVRLYYINACFPTLIIIIHVRTQVTQVNLYLHKQGRDNWQHNGAD